MTLDAHEAAWRQKGLLRRVYLGWYEEISHCLSSADGPTVELGCGIGRFKEAVPAVVLTDVEPTRYAEAVVDAEQLPFADGSVANLVLVDVFHHLARPARFLDEARRVLNTGGRVILLEPYCSPLSTLVWRYLHHEDVNLRVSPFSDAPVPSKSPWAANSALPTLVFFRGAQEFAGRFPELVVTKRRRLSVLVWPLSGGFSRRPLGPGFLYQPLKALELLLAPLLRLAAFRCLIVLERR